VKLAVSLSTLIALPNEISAQFAQDSLSWTLKVIADESDHLPWSLGGKEEADFCTETLYRAFGLLSGIHSGNVPNDKRAEDSELAGKFSNNAFWAQMHLSCLLYAIRARCAPTKDVLDELLIGMRYSVMAYAYIRQGVELREPEDMADLSLM
jgi:hypothetical protein